MYKRKQTSCTKIEIPKTLRKLLLIYLCPWRKSRLQKMPKVRLGRSAGSGSARRRPPPEGWELIEPTLEELEGRMREVETESHEGKRKVEALWPIFKIHHQRSRYIFDLFYKRKAISRGQLLPISEASHTFSVILNTTLLNDKMLQSCTTTASRTRSPTRT